MSTSFKHRMCLTFLKETRDEAYADMILYDKLGLEDEGWKALGEVEGLDEVLRTLDELLGPHQYKRPRQYHYTLKPVTPAPLDEGDRLAACKLRAKIAMTWSIHQLTRHGAIFNAFRNKDVREVADLVKCTWDQVMWSFPGIGEKYREMLKDDLRYHGLALKESKWTMMTREEENEYLGVEVH